MRLIRIGPTALLSASTLWLIAFLLISVSRINVFGMLTVIATITLCIVPGLLTMILFRIAVADFWGYLGIAISLSLIEIVLVALIGNTLLPDIGISRPLDATVLVPDISVFLSMMILEIWRRRRTFEFRLPRYMLFDTARGAILGLAPILFVPIAIAGAFRLNNGADGTLILCMLVAIAAYAAFAVYAAGTEDREVLPAILFSLALSLLFMNSLRGWHVTGHDIQREFSVFRLTKMDGIWSIARYRDAYNACMSITILPTIFSNLTAIADPYIYKALFQGLFATAVPVIFLSIRRYASAAVAFLSTFFFIAFPTFYQDMPFLNRQEIAFIFLASMIFVIFERPLPLSVRRTLFVILGIGMALSHYSTVYVFVAILIALAFARAMIAAIVPLLRRMRTPARHASAVLRMISDIPREGYLITVPMITVLIAVTFVWSGIVTDTASTSLGAVVQATLSAIGKNAQEDARSSDVSASILSWQQSDPKALLQQYTYRIVDPVIFAAPADTYYPLTTYARYPIVVAPDEYVPSTAAGRALSSLGIDLSKANYLFRQGSAKLLQILIIIGFLSVLFTGRFLRRTPDAEFYLLAGGNLLMLAAIVVLPVLSVQYGILRAFQQSLMFLGLFLVIGILVLASRWNERAGIAIAATLAILFFLSETGAITELVGGYNPQLYLNNSGLYYDLYYAHGSEIAGIDWLLAQTHGSTDSIQATSPNNLYSNSLFDVAPTAGGSFIDDIFPPLVRKDSYVFLSYATVHADRATATYAGTLITYAYPIQFLDDNKDRIYDNGDVMIYR